MRAIWLAERVVSADRDHREARVDGGDESGCRSVSRSVVTNFDDVCLEIIGPGSCEKPSFAGLPRVAHEEFAKTVGAQHDDDAVLIHVVTGIRKDGSDGANTSSVTPSPETHCIPRLGRTIGMPRARAADMASW